MQMPGAVGLEGLHELAQAGDLGSQRHASPVTKAGGHLGGGQSQAEMSGSTSHG